MVSGQTFYGCYYHPVAAIMGWVEGGYLRTGCWPGLVCTLTRQGRPAEGLGLVRLPNVMIYDWEVNLYSQANFQRWAFVYNAL